MRPVDVIGVLAFEGLLLDPGESKSIAITRPWAHAAASAVQQQIVRERPRAESLGIDVAPGDELAVTVRQWDERPDFDLVVVTRAGEAS